MNGCATSCGHRGGVGLGVLELHLALASHRDEPSHYPRGACFGCAGLTHMCLGRALILKVLGFPSSASCVLLPAKMLACYALDFFCTLGFPVWWSFSFSFVQIAPWWDDRHSWGNEHTGWNWSWHGWQAEHEAEKGWNWQATESERASSDKTRSAGHTRRWQDATREVPRSIPERTQSNTSRQSRRPPSRFRTGQVSAELWRPDNPTLGRRLEASLATSSALPSLPLTEMGGSPHQPSLDEAEEGLDNVDMDNGPGPVASLTEAGGRNISQTGLLPVHPPAPPPSKRQRHVAGNTSATISAPTTQQIVQLDDSPELVPAEDTSQPNPASSASTYRRKHRQQPRASSSSTSSPELIPANENAPPPGAGRDQDPGSTQSAGHQVRQEPHSASEDTSGTSSDSSMSSQRSDEPRIVYLRRCQDYMQKQNRRFLRRQKRRRRLEAERDCKQRCAPYMLIFLLLCCGRIAAGAGATIAGCVLVVCCVPRMIASWRHTSTTLGRCSRPRLQMLHPLVQFTCQVLRRGHRYTARRLTSFIHGSVQSNPSPTKLNFVGLAEGRVKVGQGPSIMRIRACLGSPKQCSCQESETRFYKQQKPARSQVRERLTQHTVLYHSYRPTLRCSLNS